MSLAWAFGLAALAAASPWGGSMAGEAPRLDEAALDAVVAAGPAKAAKPGGLLAFLLSGGTVTDKGLADQALRQFQRRGLTPTQPTSTGPGSTSVSKADKLTFKADRVTKPRRTVRVVTGSIVR